MKIQISDGGLSIEDVEGGVQIGLSAVATVRSDDGVLDESCVEKLLRGNDVIDLAAWLMTLAALEADGDADVWARFETTHQEALLQMARESRQQERKNRETPPEGP